MKRIDVSARSLAARVLLALLASTVLAPAGEDLPVAVEISVQRGDRPLSNPDQPLDGHFRTNGNLITAINFGASGTVLRGPGAGIPFVGIASANPSGTNWSTVAPLVDTDLNSGFTASDPLLHSEIYGAAPVSLTFSNLNPRRTYVVQFFHGEPRSCCSGIFASNEFTTRIASGDPGPTIAIPAFQLGNSISFENPPNSNDFAAVTVEFRGLTEFTYVMREALGATRGPSLAGFQLRMIIPPPFISVSVDRGDNPIGNRPADGHLRTNGVLRTAVNLGSLVDETRGPGSGILFTGGYTNNLFNPAWEALAGGFTSSLETVPTDSLFFSEIYSPVYLVISYDHLDPAREYLAQFLLGEPRSCCSGTFRINHFATRLADGSYGPTVLVPPFQLGNGIADEDPPNSNDLAVVTVRFSGLQRFLYEAYPTFRETRRPSVSGFQLRELFTPVTTLADGGPGSLRELLRDAPYHARLTFPTNFSGQTLTLSNGPLVISGNVTIDASMLPGGLNINGSGSNQLFIVASNVTATLRSLTLTNGYLADSTGTNFGGAIHNLGTLTLDGCVVSGNKTAPPFDTFGAAFGGAIYNSGTLTANDCTFAENSANMFETTGYAWGGAVANWGTMTLNRSTFSRNSAIGGAADFVGGLGGAIFNGGALTVNQCTFFGNSARATSGTSGNADGGAIFNQATVTLNQSTISGNSSIVNVGVGSICRGGGIANGGTLTVFNSIVAGNFAAESPDIAFSYTEAGTNILSGDPGLAPLGDYGGLTQTMPPQPFSPAIDAGGELGTNVFTTDQRGLSRTVGGRVDIGAVEFQDAASLAPTNLVVPPMTTLAAGTNLTLSVGFLGSAPVRYQWFLNKKALPAATNFFFNVTNVQTKNAGAYTVRVQNDFGSATSGVATVKVLLPARIKTQPKAQTVLAGKRATLKVSATGTKPLRYQWRFNSTVIPGATNSTLTFPVTAPTQEGFYSVYVWNDAGDALSTNVYLAVPPMQITSQPKNLTALAGGRVTLSVRATTRYPLSYQWKQNGTNLPGATNATFAIANAQPVHRGTYTVTLTNAVGELTTTGAVLSVTVLPVRITSHPRSINVKAGGKATFSVSAAGSPPLTYQWRLGVDEIAGATNASLILTNVQAGDAGIYSVVVRNAESEITSIGALMNVIEPALLLSAASADGSRTAVRLSIMTSADGLRRLVIVSPAGVNYILEASPDLVHWTPLMQSSEAGESEAPVVFIDGGDARQSQRFYRVRLSDGQKSPSP